MIDTPGIKSISPKVFWQTFLWTGILLSVLAILQTIRQMSVMEIALLRSKWILVVALFAFNILGSAAALMWLTRAGGQRWVENLELKAGTLVHRSFGFLLLVLGLTLPWIVRLYVFGEILPQVFPIFFVFLWSSLSAALGLKLITGKDWPILFSFIVLAQGLLYQVYGHFAIISDYPFSIGYSEAGRHYYASLFFAKSVYDMQLPLPFLHPSRYLLMSLPFLVDGLPLWAHRAWQVILWIGLTGTSSILLARRLKVSAWLQVSIAAWAFLYFLQGAVYYHLQVCVILILAGVSVRHPGRSLLFVILASLWAGISRVNWFPVPAMLAIAIYILEKPMDSKGWRYWITPFIWGIAGFGAALVAQFAYISISGNVDARTFGSSFTSDLIWNRLLPNSTFPAGVLLGIAIVSLPLLLAIRQMVQGKLAYLHSLRWLGLFSLLLILFLGGMVVSVKIGGGADLHNMDAFLVLLALIATSLFGGRAVSEVGTEPAWGQVNWPVTAAVLLVPLGFALPHIGFLPSYDHVKAEKDVQRLQAVVSQAVNDGGEVLFVTERQLLTFGILKDVSLVPEYEQIELMEMAMSGNREQLEKYYADLRNHRFAIVIAEDQKFTTQKEGAFAEENVAWVRFAGAPLLCAYKPVESLSSSNVVVFVPRPSKPNCKDPFLD